MGLFLGFKLHLMILFLGIFLEKNLFLENGKDIQAFRVNT